jgi:hypothetical protein
MTPIKLKISCRIEELPVLGGFIITSLQGSLTDFTGYSPDYNTAFISTANADLVTLEGLVNPKQLTAELKVITARIYSNLTILQTKIDLLEGYINRAVGLTIGKKDFGISAVRKMNHKGDIEGLVAALNFMLTNVSNNITAITAKGYTAAQNTALIALKDGFKADNIAQNAKVNERNNKVISNYTKFNAFWDKIMDICDAGKRIYKSTAPNRLDDFTMTKLKARINQERNNTRFEGVIKSEGAPLNGAKVEMKPLGVGRKRSIKTKADGKYIIKSIAPGDYMITVSASGKITVVDEVTIVTGETLSKDWVMV